ncbi:tetratricopeptide repeat protein [bacterium]|nr:tetratricopeptide repeat protein [bacterium]
MSRHKDHLDLFITAIKGRAESYLFLGEIDNALNDCATALSKDLPDESTITLKLLKAEVFLRGKEDFAASEEVVTEVFQHDNLKQNPKLYSQAINLMGGIKRYAGEFDSALEFYEKSLELNRKKSLYSNMGIISTNIASLYHIKGQFEKAVEYLTKAQTAFIRSGDIFNSEDMKKDLGLMQLEMGNYDEAEVNFLQYLKNAKKLSYRKGEAEVCNFLGYLYEATGDLKSSLLYRKNYLRLAKELKENYLISSAKNSIGMMYQCKGENKKAEKMLNEALREAQNNKYINLIAIIMLNLISNYLAQRDFRKARNHLKKAENIILPMKNSNYSFHLHQGYAQYQEDVNDHAQAVRYYHLAKDNAEDMDNHKLVISTWSKMIDCMEKIPESGVEQERAELEAYAEKFDLLSYLEKEEW